jgi:two-component system response regulator NreC
MQKIRVLVVDDHTIVRDGICALLGLAGDIEVVGEASNGIEAINAVRKLKPDVILMDIAMPVMGGLEATHKIRDECPEIKVLALTQYNDKEYVFPVLEAGASGFISKASASSELSTGIRCVYRGDSFLSPSITKLLVEDFRESGAIKKKSDPYDDLTRREKEIFKLLAEGYTTQKIADTLTISPKTAEGHKTSLMSKLDIHNRAELVKYALRKGVISI